MTQRRSKIGSPYEREKSFGCLTEACGRSVPTKQGSGANFQQPSHLCSFDELKAARGPEFGQPVQGSALRPGGRRSMREVVLALQAQLA